MNIDSFPVIIEFVSGKIFGVLRGLNSVHDRIIIFCPATTGTRIGPQRIFVEIAQKLMDDKIASFCVDMPPLGDSFDTEKNNFQGTTVERLTQYYSKYLEIIIDFFKKKYGFKEFILLSISDGGIPVYNYAMNIEEIKKIILLSPNHKLGSNQKLNKKNLKQYYNKLSRKETWIKLFTFKLNFRKIIRNIYVYKSFKTKMIQFHESRTICVKEKVLVIFGEKDLMLNESIDFWNKEQSNGRFKNYSCEIVKDADHSFFGWEFKRYAEKYITDWLKNE